MNKHLQRRLSAARSGQLGGFWSDVLNLGEEAARSAARATGERIAGRIAASAGGDHIREQNRIVDEFGKVVAAVDAGAINRNQGASDIERLIDEFQTYTRIVNTQRAANGFRDVEALGRQIIADLVGTGSVATTGSGYYYVTSRPSSGGLSLGMLAVFGIGGALLLSRGRR